MAAGQEKINKVKAFFGEVVGEMKKCTWPQKQELMESTIVVIVSIFLLAAFVALSDVVLIRLLKLVFP